MIRLIFANASGASPELLIDNANHAEIAQFLDGMPDHLRDSSPMKAAIPFIRALDGFDMALCSVPVTALDDALEFIDGSGVNLANWIAFDPEAWKEWDLRALLHADNPREYDNPSSSSAICQQTDAEIPQIR